MEYHKNSQQDSGQRVIVVPLQECHKEPQQYCQAPYKENGIRSKRSLMGFHARQKENGVQIQSQKSQKPDKEGKIANNYEFLLMSLDKIAAGQFLQKQVKFDEEPSALN
eukprot:TRINITY_DN135084_c0_g1_i1.p11 TRINITY_DN135084_c0_g1~~TRINITY_DN135084_c0_g1_i1.p11  ORF type:complete len:109 (+),score=3.67 TRINITY_DN135084_c0_g1_i1:2411-2737(+)